MYIYINDNTCTCIHTCNITCIFTGTLMIIHVHVHVCMHVHVHIVLCVCIHVYVHVVLHVYTSTCTYTCIIISVHIHIPHLCSTGITPYLYHTSCSSTSVMHLKECLTTYTHFSRFGYSSITT